MELRKPLPPTPTLPRKGGGSKNDCLLREAHPTRLTQPWHTGNRVCHGCVSRDSRSCGTGAKCGKAATFAAAPVCERYVHMNANANPMVRCYQAWIGALRHAQPALLLALRVLIGFGFFLAGYGKLTNIDATAMYFKGLGIPMPLLNAYMAGTTETVGGVLLILGLASRIITLPLIGTMIVAYGTAHSDVFDGMWADLPGFVKAFVAAPAFPYLTVVLVVLLFGPGLFSMDGLLKRFYLDRMYGDAASANFGGAHAQASPGHRMGLSDPAGIRPGESNYRER